jgi:hypothetical protein
LPFGFRSGILIVELMVKKQIRLKNPYNPASENQMGKLKTKPYGQGPIAQKVIKELQKQSRTGFKTSF